MENIIYEYTHDKSTKMKIFLGVNSNSPRHFHRCIEILYVIEGEIETTIGNDSFVAGCDDIIFVHNYYVHSFAPKNKYKKYVLIIPSSFVGDVDKIFKTQTLPPLLRDKAFNKEFIRPYFEKLINEYETMPTLVKKGYLNLIMGLLLDNYPSLPVKTSENIELMVDVLYYIDEHYREPLTLDSVANEFGYNKYYFSRVFNRNIGESLANYINVVRLQYFMRMSKECKNPHISKFAEECGFESMPTFYRCFQKIYGESPKAYFSKR